MMMLVDDDKDVYIGVHDDVSNSIGVGSDNDVDDGVDVDVDNHVDVDI